MGLKQDLVNAKKAGMIAGGTNPASVNTGPGSPIDVEMTMVSAAIAKLLLSVDFRITKLNAPVVMENFNIPEQDVDVGTKTLLGEYGPILDTLKAIAGPLGLSKMIKELENKLKLVIGRVSQAGATLRKVEVNKDDGTGLESTGYTFIGEDPVSEENFDIGDRDGTRTFTAVKLLPEDIKDFL